MIEKLKEIKKILDNVIEMQIQQDWQLNVCIDCKYFNTDECPRENEENTGKISGQQVDRY